MKPQVNFLLTFPLMTWWFPFKIEITGEWIAAIAGLFGVALGYWLEGLRNRKSEKQRKIERVLAIHSQYEGLGVKIIRAAVNSMMFSLVMNYESRRKQILIDEKQNSGLEWERVSTDAKNHALKFLEETNNYTDLVAEVHALMVEFRYYLPRGEKIDLRPWGKFSVNKFGGLKELSKEELKKVEKEKLTRDIHETYLKELQGFLSPINKRMQTRIEELEQEPLYSWSKFLLRSSKK